MRTNREKFDYYMELIEHSDNDYIECYAVKWNKLYKVYPKKLQECIVTGISYYRQKLSHRNKGSISRELVSEARQLYESGNYKNREDQYIMYRCEYYDNIGKSSFCINLHDLKHRHELFYNHTEATSVFNNNALFMDENDKKLKSGLYFRCGYCGKVEENKNKVVFKTTYRKGNPTRVVSEDMNFCSGRCAGRNQMSLEG